MALQPVDEHFHRHRVLAALGNDEVGPALAGLHELLVHGLHGGQVLGDHAVQRAAALFHVPHDAPQDAHVGVGVHEHLDVHQIAQLRAGKDEDALHQDHRRGVDLDEVIGAVVLGEIVHRAQHRLARLQGLDVLHHQLRLKGVGVVVVGQAPLLVGQLVLALVVVVVADDADLVAEALLQPLGQRGLSAAGTAGNAQYHNAHTNVSFMFVPPARCRRKKTGDLAPRGLPAALSPQADWAGPGRRRP